MLILCGFVQRFILRDASYFKVFQCFLSSCFVIPLSTVIISVGEEGAGLCASRAFVCCFVHVSFCHFFSSSWCRGLATVCDCGTSWTFQLTFFTKCTI